jgi:hypothetical protein
MYICTENTTIMITVSKEVFIEANQLNVDLPGVPEGEYEVLIVLQPRNQPKPRKAGFLTEKIWMSDDFNDPLEDFKDYM